MRTVFFGTPDAAVPALAALISSEHQVALVVTAPDRPRGRGLGVEPVPVKKKALEAGLEVVQPSTLRANDVKRHLAALGADVFVVAAYGLILPPEVLNIPRLGCLNVHFSLLPRLRGAAPVQWALIEGHDLTGVTIMQMDEGVDTGGVLSQISEPITDSDDASTLEGRLAKKGASLLVATMEAFEKGEIEPVPQDDSLATNAPKISPDQARIDWSLAAQQIRNRVRAFRPRPGAWTIYNGRRLKIWAVEATSDRARGGPGTLQVNPEGLVVDTGDGRIALVELQPEGKRRMTAGEFVRGYNPATGDELS